MTKAEELISNIFPHQNFREHRRECDLAERFHAYVLMHAISLFHDHKIWTRDEIAKVIEDCAMNIHHEVTIIFPNSPYK